MLGAHLIVSAYGLWLPNDPRGSWSTSVRAQHLYEVGGDATKVVVRNSVAGRPHDRRSRLEAKQKLARPAVKFDGVQARAIVRGIAALLPKIKLAIHALAVMPDHVHVVAAPQPLDLGKLIEALKRAGTRGMNAEQRHPFVDHPRSNGRLPSPWAAGGWKVLLYTPEDMRRTIKYVEQNPVRAGLKPQRWNCVTPYRPAPPH